MFKSEFNFACINYVDVFGGVEKNHTTASTAFHQLANLFQRLGLESPPSKDWVPSTHMLFLGLVYDTLKGPLKYLVAKLHGCYPGANSLPVSQNFFARFFRRRPLADSSRCLTFLLRCNKHKKHVLLTFFY